MASPVREAFQESAFAGLYGDRQLKVDDVQEAYLESKNRCVLFSIATRLVVNLDAPPSA